MRKGKSGMGKTGTRFTPTRFAQTHTFDLHIDNLKTTTTAQHSLHLEQTSNTSE